VLTFFCCKIFLQMIDALSRSRCIDATPLSI